MLSSVVQLFSVFFCFLVMPRTVFQCCLLLSTSVYCFLVFLLLYSVFSYCLVLSIVVFFFIDVQSFLMLSSIVYAVQWVSSVFQCSLVLSAAVQCCLLSYTVSSVVQCRILCLVHTQLYLVNTIYPCNPGGQMLLNSNQVFPPLLFRVEFK